MLACARIGAVHSIVFAGFSAESLRERILDGRSHFVVTADEGKRGGRTLHLKTTVDIAVRSLKTVNNVFVFRRTGADVEMVPDRDVSMETELAGARPYCPAERMDSEDTLFLLYTSGSTGRPKVCCVCVDS
jgi:acetyl-CoA synthetase